MTSSATLPCAWCQSTGTGIYSNTTKPPQHRDRVMYKTLLHVMFGCNDGNGNVYRQDVFNKLQLPVAPTVGFRFCPDSRRMNECDEWEVEEVIYDINAATFIAVARCMDCEEPGDVDAYLKAFVACGWKTGNPLGY